MSAGDRWQSTAYTPAQPQIAMGPRSATVTYPMTYPQYTPSHSYLPVLDPRSMPDEVPSVDQMHTFDRSGQLRTSRTASACERRASIVTSPYAPPPATDDNPQIKKKRKRADAAQLQVLNEVYSRTAFPSTEERAELARKLDMTPRSVQIWSAIFIIVP
jgi:homeobox protein YOX1/YHP1